MGALRKKLHGEVITDLAARRHMSHDGSVYELTPEVIVEPLDSTDIEALVSFVLKHKKEYSQLAITPRGGGTDKTGGAIGSSIVLDLTTHLNNTVSLRNRTLKAQAGTYLRDVEPLLAAKNLQLSCAPVHAHLHTIGGIVATNSSGAHAQYGNASHAVRELQVVLGDGRTYTVKPLTKRQLDKKMAEDTYEGRLYTRVFALIEKNYDLIKNARPRSTKQNSGYALWDVWDRDTGIFDLTKLFAGSQGTLGIITDVTLEVMPRTEFTHTVVAYLPSSRHLSAITEAIMKYKPTIFESVDDLSFSLGLRHFTAFRRQIGTRELLRHQRQRLGSLFSSRHHPGMHFTISFEGPTKQAVFDTIAALYDDLKTYGIHMDLQHSNAKRPRRASLSLIHPHVEAHHPLPLIGDITVPSQHAPAFIHELRNILHRSALPVTIHSHMGSGTFHIVPLVATHHHFTHEALEPLLRELIPIVTTFGGTMASEHNDGMALGPWLPVMFGNEMYHVFRELKEIFDPLYIFNPHKKTDAAWEYSLSHVRTRHDNYLPKQR